MKAKDDLLRRKNVPKAITSKKKSRVAGPKSGAANLKLLIDEAILSPGIGVLSLEYRGTREIANLCADGRIQWKGTKAYQKLVLDTEKSVEWNCTNIAAFLFCR